MSIVKLLHAERLDTKLFVSCILISKYLNVPAHTRRLINASTFFICFHIIRRSMGCFIGRFALSVNCFWF